MDDATFQQLEAMFAKHPVMRGTAASDAQIEAAERQLACTFTAGYRDFLRRYGAAMVRSLPLFGLSPVEVLGDDWWDVVTVTRQFRAEGWPGSADWYVISDDGSGNPVGIDAAGRVWVSDHDTREIALVASDFDTWLRAATAQIT